VEKAPAADRRRVVLVDEERPDAPISLTCIQAGFRGLKHGVVVGTPDGQGNTDCADLSPGIIDAHIAAIKDQMPAPAPAVPIVNPIVPFMPVCFRGTCCVVG
jgi:hypothetical protein